MKKLALSLLICGLGMTWSHAEEGADKPKREKKPELSAEERFATLDTDSNGGISLSEFSGRQREGMQKKLEGKEDAEAKLAEFDARTAEKFKSKDADGSGEISLDEFKAKPMKPEAAKGEKKPMKKHKQQGAEAAPETESAP
jgi:hypothetical protein